MGLDQIALVFLGALAGGFVNGLTGFGLAISAMGLWLYVIAPPVAASLAIICSVVSQLQTLPMIWRSIEWGRVLPFIVPGLLGVPLGTWLLPHIDPKTFKIVVGLFLVAYPGYVLVRRKQMSSKIGGRGADGAIGLGGGVLGGLTGFSGVLPAVWTDIRGSTKEQRRGVLQTYNTAILGFALLTHAYSGFLDRRVALAASAALPGAIGGAWAGGAVYRRLGNRGFQQAVMALLLISGVTLIVSSR
jgi:uncharacterized membrane protein YfcA